MSAKQADSSIAAVNFPELMSRVEDDREFLLELLDVFHLDFPRYHQELRAALSQKNLPQVAFVSHTLKGMLANLAASRAAAVLGNLEQLAKQGKTEALEGVAEEFEHEMTGVLAELETFKSGG